MSSNTTRWKWLTRIFPKGQKVVWNPDFDQTWYQHMKNNYGDGGTVIKVYVRNTTWLFPKDICVGIDIPKGNWGKAVFLPEQLIPVF